MTLWHGNMYCIAGDKRVCTHEMNSYSHYNDVIMGTMASQITGLMIVYSTVYSGADQRKLQSSASLAFVRGIHRWPVNSPHKWPVTWKMFPFDDVIMLVGTQLCSHLHMSRYIHCDAELYYMAKVTVVYTINAMDSMVHDLLSWIDNFQTHNEDRCLENFL